MWGSISGLSKGDTRSLDYIVPLLTLSSTLPKLPKAQLKEKLVGVV